MKEYGWIIERDFMVLGIWRLSMLAEAYKVRARLVIRHERPYDFDALRGVWLYKPVSPDEEAFNLVTDLGRVNIHTYIYGTAPQRILAGLGTGFNRIALSNDPSPPAPGDTTLAGELVGNGLTRDQGTVTLPTGAGTVTSISKQFVYTGGGTQGVRKTALFDDPAAGNMAHEISFTQRSLQTNDSLFLTFYITIS